MLGFVLILTVNASMNINIKQPNAHMYHQQSPRNGEFNYGYHVNTVSNQFQHKVKGPDDVTYGCYGYVDPSNKKHLVYYVADRRGYRIIFPNRPTKIFTARVSDSLNKLDGSVKSADYDEKVVAWNDLYLPDGCFRLDEILSTASSTLVQQVTKPERIQTATTRIETISPAESQPVPTHPPQTTVLGVINPVQSGPGNVQEYGRESDNDLDSDDQQTEATFSAWSGTLPDINPANINLDQFDLRNGLEGTTGKGNNNQFVPQQYGLNITQLLAQMEAVNSQVITLNTLLAGMAKNPAIFGSANEGSCRTVVQLLQTQKTTPHLLYVPILIPFIEGQHNINQPFGVPLERYQQHRV